MKPAIAHPAPSHRGRPRATYVLVLLVAVLLASLLLGLAQRADASVYYASSSKLGRANLDGSGANVNFITGLTSVAGIAVNDTYVYWSSNVGSGNGTISRAKLDGSGAEVIVTGLTNPQAIAIDGTYLYWGNAGGVNTISRAKLDGTEIDQSFITGTNAPIGLAVDSGHIYWANNGSNAIGRANVNGTEVSQSFITAGVNSPIGLAVDASYIYWGNFGGGGGESIGRASINGTGSTENFIRTEIAPRSVAVDGSHVYWSNFGFGFGTNYGRADLNGSNANQNFITGVSGPFGIAADGRRTAETTATCVAGAAGRATTCTATVTDTESGTPVSPTGTVTFSSTGTGSFEGDGTCTLAPAEAGTASCTVGYTPAEVGTETVTADFGGGPTATSGSGTAELTVVEPAATTTTTTSCTPSPVYAGDEVSCLATVTDTSDAPTAPAGEVTFSSSQQGTFPGGASCTLAPQGSDRSTCAVSYSSVYWSQYTPQKISAAYAGSSDHDPSTGQADLEVLRVHQTKSTLTCETDSPVASAPVTCTANVIDTDTPPTAPTGAVTFGSDSGGAFDPLTCTLAPVDAGSSSCTTAFTPSAKGVVGLSAAFDGAPAYLATSAVAVLRVAAAPVGPQPLECSPGFVPAGDPPVCREPVKPIEAVPPKPSNSFSKGKPAIDGSKGTAKLPLSLPGPGRVVARGSGVVKVTRTVKAKGRLRIVIRATGGARRTLQRKGHVSLRVQVTYTPTGGRARTQKLSVRLVLAAKNKKRSH